MNLKGVIEIHKVKTYVSLLLDLTNFFSFQGGQPHLQTAIFENPFHIFDEFISLKFFQKITTISQTLGNEPIFFQNGQQLKILKFFWNPRFSQIPAHKKTLFLKKSKT